MIITIARQCGCGGHEVARILANKLGMELFDKKKLLEEAKQLGQAEEHSNFFNEVPINSLLYGIAMGFGNTKPMDKSLNLLRLLPKQRRQLLEDANIIYKDSKDVTSVYLFADKEFRIKHIMERDGISEKEAEKYIKEVDEKRTSFHKYCTDTVWGDAKEYQLCLDTGKIGFEKTAELIMNYINAKKES
ncbi:MAG: AAA family ATPase [Eubacterium ventriosum]